MSTRTASLSGVINRMLSESLVEQSDRQLLDRFEQAGDEAAFEGLVSRHGPMILGLCRRLLASHDLADDVFQATFLLLARKSRSIWGASYCELAAPRCRQHGATSASRGKCTGPPGKSCG